MGKVYAPSYANFYMARWEQEALAKCQCRSTVYPRFLDDIFGLFPYDADEFRKFEQVLNSHYPTIKVRSTVSTERISPILIFFFFLPLYRYDGTMNPRAPLGSPR